jgi:hypothetical protein
MTDNPASHFGKVVKRDRLARGWSLPELAKVTGIDAGHWSRIENGKRPPTLKIAAACDNAFPERRNWYTDYFNDLQKWSEVPSWFKPWHEFEMNASSLRSWSPGSIDGLMQTEAYARAQIGLAPGITPDQVAERVANRMARQQRVLYREEPPLVHFLVSLVSLRDMPRELVPDQVRRLLDVSALPNVTLQVSPALWNAGMNGSLIIAQNAAYTESLLAGQVYADEETVSSLSRRFASIASDSMRTSDTTALLKGMVDRGRLAQVQLQRRREQRLCGGRH